MQQNKGSWKTGLPWSYLQCFALDKPLREIQKECQSYPQTTVAHLITQITEVPVLFPHIATQLFAHLPCWLSQPDSAGFEEVQHLVV